MHDSAAEPVSYGTLGVVLSVGGVLGMWASFALLMDDFALLNDPGADLLCTIDATVQCGKNILSWQGQVFGFPNPVLGLMMFPAPLVVGTGLLAGARFATWFWWLFNAGLLFGTGFVFWLAFESIFSLNTLCLWCSLVYLVTIPMFVAVTTTNLAAGRAGSRMQRVGLVLTPWTVLISILAEMFIFGAAQLHLNILDSLF